MNLLSAAERLGAFDQASIRFDPPRCLHAFDRFSECQACFATCPSGAVLADASPQFDEKACTRCLACLPVCPTGAFHAGDALPGMLNCVPRLPSGGVELVCERQSAPQPAFPDSSVIIRLRGCLAGLGPGALVALVAAGVTSLHLRTEACPGCPWASLEQQIDRQVQAASQLLQPWGYARAIACGDPASDQPLAPIPVWDADNPPLSRRDLFRMGSRQGSVAVARAMKAETEKAAPGMPPRERRRLLAAMAHLPARQDPVEPVRMQGSQWGVIAVSEECTACGVCARICPTGAISFNKNDAEASFQLFFRPPACTACAACIHACAPGALHLDRDPSFEQIFAQPEPVTLLEGALKRCERCNAWMPASRPEKLCPVCLHRRRHPFGSALPPGFDIGVLPVEKGTSP